MDSSKGRVSSIVLAVLMLAACTSYQAVAIDAIPSEVDPGDQVRVIEKDGNEHGFEVTAIDEEAIEGAGVRIPVSEIRSIKVKKFSRGRTLFAGLGIGYVVILIVVSIAIIGIVDNLFVLG